MLFKIYFKMKSKEIIFGTNIVWKHFTLIYIIFNISIRIPFIITLNHKANICGILI